MPIYGKSWFWIDFGSPVHPPPRRSQPGSERFGAARAVKSQALVRFGLAAASAWEWPTAATTEKTAVSERLRSPRALRGGFSMVWPVGNPSPLPVWGQASAQDSGQNHKVVAGFNAACSLWQTPELLNTEWQDH